MKWEIRSVEVRFDKVGESPLHLVNKAGRDGWEPVGVFNRKETTFVLMKRKIDD